MLNNTQEQIQVIKCLAVIMCKLRHPVGLVSGASSARRNLLKLINIRYSCVILRGRKVHTTLVPMTTHEFLRLGVIFFFIWLWNRVRELQNNNSKNRSECLNVHHIVCCLIINTQCSLNTVLRGILLSFASFSGI